MATQNDKAFFNSWASTMLAQSEQVRNLIGDSHWLSDGHHKESLVREAIEKYVPNAAVVASGFLKPQRPDVSCSKELDVLIFDPVSHTPYFHQNGFAIVPPSSAIGHVEIKSNFTKPFIREALLNIMVARNLKLRFSPNADLWSGICFFHTPQSRTLNTIGKTICDAVLETVSDKDNRALYLSETVKEQDTLPTCIFSINSFIAFIKYDYSNKKIRVTVFSTNELSSALAFNDLFSRIRNRFGGVCSDDLNSLLLDVCGTDVPQDTYSREI